MSPRVGYTLAISGALFATVIILAMVKVPDTGLPDRIQRECERQFAGFHQTIINDCVIRLMTRTIDEGQRQRLDSAYQRSR